MTIKNTSFIHFNDVYGVDNAPKFVTSVKKQRSAIKEAKSGGDPRHVITVFSGDAFSPSFMATVLRGEHMVPCLNAIGIDVACLGNHDLDFGIQEFKELNETCNFPWVCSNAWDLNDNEPLGGCDEFIIIDKTNEGGPRILTLGLIEQAWLDSLSSVDPGNITFEHPWDYVKRRVPDIQAEFGPFDMVLAATHMRMPNDIKLAEHGGVDIILGGHDHHYEDIVVNDIRILNSSTDFKAFTVVDVNGRNANGSLDTTARRVKVEAGEEPDQQLADEISGFQAMVNESMNEVVGKSKVRLDARFSEVRTKETNIGNFLAELMARSTGADIGFLNSGTIRADRFVEPGQLIMKDLCDLLPMADESKVIELTGDKVLLALENGVSKYPAFDGRFPCVHGIRFAFDPSQPSGSRVVPGSVFVRDRPIINRRRTIIRGSPSPMKPVEDVVKIGNLNMDDVGEDGCPNGFSLLEPTKKYSLVGGAYILNGKEGFKDAFLGAPVLQDVEECPLLPTILRNIFTELRDLSVWAGTTTQGTVIDAVTKFKRIVRRSAADPFSINPQIDGRIRIVGQETPSRTEVHP